MTHSTTISRHLDGIKPLTGSLTRSQSVGSEFMDEMPSLARPKTELVFITAEMAREWLKAPRAFTRNIRPSNVSKMTQDMLNGTFTLSPTMISFGYDREGNDGALHNGQHRLSAIVSASIRNPDFKGIESWVGWHQPYAAVESADCGAARSFGDLLHDRGYAYYAHLAAVVRAMFRWDERQIPAKIGPSTAVAKASPAAHIRRYPTFAEMSAYLDEHEDELLAAVAIAAELYEPAERIIRTSVLGCAYYMFARIDSNRAQKYLRSFDVSYQRPVPQALEVRRRLAAGHKSGVRYDQAEELELLILGWNSFVKGNKTVKHPVWSNNTSGKKYIKPDDYSRPEYPASRGHGEDL